MSGNNKERDKSARERGIFLEFARVAPLNIDPASVQSEKPPKPDINSKIDRQISFFELAEIADNGEAREHHPRRPLLLSPNRELDSFRMRGF